VLWCPQWLVAFVSPRSAFDVIYRIFLHIVASCLCRWSGTISPCAIWTTTQYTEDTIECCSAASWHHCRLYFNREWIPVLDQLFCCCLLGFLFLDGKFPVNTLNDDLIVLQVLGLLILRVKEPLLERYVFDVCLNAVPQPRAALDHIELGSLPR